jgi:uncharacterized cupredoxin-like copper-binding protein
MGRAGLVLGLGSLMLLGAAPAAPAPAVPATRTVPARAEKVVVLTIHHSRFSADTLRVAPGTDVRFVIRNTDPIGHELIIGDAGVQLRHERGTEAHHGARAGEVSVEAGAEATTHYVFGAPGRLMFGCHLPGHWSYGMHGVIEIAA